MQRVVLAVVLRKYPVLLTFPAIACELFENPDDLVGGMALARAVRDLADSGFSGVEAFAGTRAVVPTGTGHRDRPGVSAPEKPLIAALHSRYPNA